MSERIGPHVSARPHDPHLTCIGCKFLESHVVQTGLNPQYKMQCAHEDADPHTGGFISYEGDVRTPSWCPFRKNRNHDTDLKNRRPEI